MTGESSRGDRWEAVEQAALLVYQALCMIVGKTEDGLVIQWSIAEIYRNLFTSFVLICKLKIVRHGPIKVEYRAGCH